MNHVRFTCKNHPTLRWMCKEIAVNPDGKYNHSRNIFFLGRYVGKQEGKHFDCEEVIDGKLVEECKCSSGDLVRIDDK